MNEPAGTTSRPGTRADAQRERILLAAQRCFIEHGFHAASMASIADAAQMSAGLMYRYFENKEAIVLAIVERQLEEKRSAIRQLHSAEEFTARMIEAYESWRARDPHTMSAALVLEMSAEATRNPKIAEALRSSDRRTRGELQAWLARSRDEGGLGLAADVAASRTLLLRSVLEGLVMRAAREPDLDPVELKAALDDLFAKILA
jgi:AcrR family transcriptional regulator